MCIVSFPDPPLMGARARGRGPSSDGGAREGERILSPSRAPPSEEGLGTRLLCVLVQYPLSMDRGSEN